MKLRLTQHKATAYPNPLILVFKAAGIAFCNTCMQHNAPRKPKLNPAQGALHTVKQISSLLVYTPHRACLLAGIHITPPLQVPDAAGNCFATSTRCHWVRHKHDCKASDHLLLQSVLTTPCNTCIAVALQLWPLNHHHKYTQIIHL